MRIYILIGILVLGMTIVGVMTGYLVALFRGVPRRKVLIYGVSLGLVLAVGTVVLQRFMYSIHEGALLNLVRPVLIELNGLVVALIGTFVALAIFGVVYGLLRLATGPVKENDPIHIGRRNFFKRTAVVVPAVVGVTGSVAAFQGNNELQLRRLQLSLKDRPEVLKGYKIGQLSDVHIGPFIGMDKLKEMVNAIASEHPHRLVITGDLIDDLAYLDEVADYLDGRVQDFPDGIDYILGNHEYRVDVERVWNRLSQTKMHMYRNSHQQILGGPRPVYLVGMDYHFKDDVLEENVRLLDKAMKGIPDNGYPILLAHHPNYIPEAFRRHIPLTLSGHTHGGQINLWGTNLVPVYKPYWKGLYEEQGLFAYVSRGSGHWFPVRMNCTREVTVFSIL